MYGSSPVLRKVSKRCFCFMRSCRMIPSSRDVVTKIYRCNKSIMTDLDRGGLFSARFRPRGDNMTKLGVLGGFAGLRLWR